jgi:hypothetical protein
VNCPVREIIPPPLPLLTKLPDILLLALEVMLMLPPEEIYVNVDSVYDKVFPDVVKE